MSDDSIEPRPEEPGGSPFDAIRHEDENGEHWFARELMAEMAYEKWENFEAVIDRAIRSAENTGTYSERAFSWFQEHVTTRGNAPDKERSNYRLSRYAAYLVAMNGDPNKPRVAAAQAYFAVRTHEAEAAAGKPMTEIEMARKYVAVLEREQELSKELEVAKPKASKWDTYLNSEGLIGMTELADLLQTDVRRLTAWLVEINLFRKQTSESGGGRNLPRKAFQDSGHFEVKIEHKNGWSFPTAYATARGVDLVVDSWGRRTSAET